MTPFVTLYRGTELALRGVALVGVLFLFAATVITVGDIVLRRAFQIAVPGTVDIMQLCVMAAAFAAIPYAFIAGSHVSVDLATEKLPFRPLALVKMLAALAALVVMALIGWYGWQRAQLQIRFGDRSQTIGIPMIYYWLPLIVGCALSVLASALMAVSGLLSAITGRPVPPPRPAEPQPEAAR